MGIASWHRINAQIGLGQTGWWLGPSSNSVLRRAGAIKQLAGRRWEHLCNECGSPGCVRPGAHAPDASSPGYHLDSIVPRKSSDKSVRKRWSSSFRSKHNNEDDQAMACPIFCTSWIVRVEQRRRAQPFFTNRNVSLRLVQVAASTWLIRAAHSSIRGFLGSRTHLAVSS